MSYYRTRRHRDYESSGFAGRLSGEPVSLYDKDRDADFPLLLVMRHDVQPTRSVAGAVAQIVDLLCAHGVELIRADGTAAARAVVSSQLELVCVLIEPDDQPLQQSLSLIELIRLRNPRLPVFLLEDSQRASAMPREALDPISGSVWASEDTPALLADRITHAIDDYRETLHSPLATTRRRNGALGLLQHQTDLASPSSQHGPRQADPPIDSGQPPTFKAPA
jgi:hypothetical protein